MAHKERLYLSIVLNRKLKGDHSSASIDHGVPKTVRKLSDLLKYTYDTLSHTRDCRRSHPSSRLWCHRSVTPGFSWIGLRWSTIVRSVKSDKKDFW